MGKNQKKAPAPTHGVAAAQRRAKHERAKLYDDTIWRGLNALKSAPTLKHKSYFEVVENEDKKTKKLEFEITKNSIPPPGFEFIPTGHPELSKECKEICREKEAMYFIVSTHTNVEILDHHMNRRGYHFRQTIVDDARKTLAAQGFDAHVLHVHKLGDPEPIPHSQRQINLEADAVLRDLFPRIPHTDRRQIIQHAFKKQSTEQGHSKVGMADKLTLARRVQLAALAHIRHTCTRYDQLLKETDWANARKAVEKPCLDIIVKWRGDEETGRDQLDEILREVIEISDNEGESGDESSSGADISRPQTTRNSAAPLITDQSILSIRQPLISQNVTNDVPGAITASAPHTPLRVRKVTKAEKKAARQTQQRFRRYALAAEAFSSTSDQTNQVDGTMADIHMDIDMATPRRATAIQGALHAVGSNAIPSPTVVHVAQENLHRHRDTDVSLSRPNGYEAYHAPSHSIHRGLASEIICIPDAQRPKVGPYSAVTSRAPPPPMSPVRLGLQDMLLPSIEPRSPNGPISVHKRGYSGTQQLVPNSQAVTRTIDATAAPASRLPDLRPLASDELSAKRRRTTFFPEDYQDPEDHGAEMPPRRGVPIPTTREYSTHQGASTNNGDGVGPLRRVVEIRESPRHGIVPREISPHARYAVPSSRPPESAARIRDYPSTSRVAEYTHQSRYDPGLGHQRDTVSRPLTYREVRSEHSPSRRSFPTVRQILEPPAQNPVSREPEVYRIVEEAPNRSSNTYRQSELAPADPSRFQRYAATDSREIRRQPEFYVVRSAAPNDSGSVVARDFRPETRTATGVEYYREGQPSGGYAPAQRSAHYDPTWDHYAPSHIPDSRATPGSSVYVSSQRPFPVDPAPSSRVEIRGPPTRNYRDVYVD